MTPEIIIERLRAAGATIDGEASEPVAQITKQDLMELGLSGCKESSFLRQKLMKKLELPEHLSANGLLQALNMLCTLEELRGLVDGL